MSTKAADSIVLWLGAALVGVVLVAAWVHTAGRVNSSRNLAAAHESVNQHTMESQLHIEDVTTGSGKEAKPGQTVAVHYTGTFEDGEKFDSSHDRGEPLMFTLGVGQVIEGWDLGVTGMKEGGKRKLVIPPELGYGQNDVGPIPGGSTLHFDVELVSVVDSEE